MKKIEEGITIQDLIDFANKHNLPMSTRLGICLADSERGDLAGGIIADMVGIQRYDEYGEEVHYIDGTVYCKNMDGFAEEAEDDVIIITDGCHRGE